MSKSLSGKVLDGMKWKFTERISVQIINALTPILLARLLTPNDFGVIAILMVFISIANTLVNNGLCTVIIQRKNVDNDDCSTVFFTQFILSLLCYLVIFFAAPFIANFYGNKDLCLMLRVLSVSVIIGSLSAMQITIMKKNMEFGKSFLINVIGNVSYAICGCGLAFKGYGAWSLIYATIINQTAISISSIISINWRPKFVFSVIKLKKLFGYSWKLSVGWIIGTIHQDLYTLVVGKRFNSTVLGYYNRSSSIPSIILKTMSETVDNVMFPALSQIQDEHTKLCKTTKIMLSTNAYLLCALFFGLAATSENIISILLTDKWLPAAPMMSIVCITYMLNALNNSNMQIFNAMGHSEIFMNFEIIKRSLSIILLIICSYINIYAVLIGLTFMALLSNVMNAYQNKKLLGIPYREQIGYILPYMATGMVMAVIIYLLGKSIENRLISLCVQIISGAVIYVIVSIIFKFQPFQDILQMITRIVKRDGM